MPIYGKGVISTYICKNMTCKYNTKLEASSSLVSNCYKVTAINLSSMNRNLSAVSGKEAGPSIRFISPN